MIDEKRIVNMRDRVKVSFNHSIIESISNNGEVKLKIIMLECKLDKNKINENQWMKNLNKK